MAESTKKTTTKTSSEEKVPRLHEREPRIVLRDTGYALAGLTNETLELVRELPDRLEELREEAPELLKQLREGAPDRLNRVQGNAKATIVNQRRHYESRVRDLRDLTRKQLEERVEQLEDELDKRAAEGREVHDQLRDDERFAKLEEQLKVVVDQARSTRRQFKAAFTSVRKTADAALKAGREQASTARRQVKAAATSARRSAETVVEAGKEIAG